MPACQRCHGTNRRKDQSQREINEGQLFQPHIGQEIRQGFREHHKRQERIQAESAEEAEYLIIEHPADRAFFAEADGNAEQHRAECEKIEHLRQLKAQHELHIADRREIPAELDERQQVGFCLGNGSCAEMPHDDIACHAREDLGERFICADKGIEQVFVLSVENEKIVAR